MGVQSGNNNGVDSELLEQEVKVGVEETAVASLGNDIVALAESSSGMTFAPSVPAIAWSPQSLSSWSMPLR